MITLGQSGAIKLEPLDEDRGEMWVTADLRDGGTCSSEHMTLLPLLEEIRKRDLTESKEDIKALRRFFKSPGCRLTHFAKLYGFPTPKRCGHCDRCRPDLHKSRGKRVAANRGEKTVV